MRFHRPPATGTLIAAAFLLAMQSAAAADLRVHVKDDTGKPVADAVVYVSPRDGAFPKTPPREHVVMDQRDREFVPYVLPVQVGTPVQFPNSDNIRHHVYSFSPAKTFELPLYKGTPMTAVVFDKPGAVALGCNIHDWMIGYIYVLETPYFGKTGGPRRGARLSSLPAGEVEVRVWHPRLKDGVDKTLRPVTLSAGGGRASSSRSGSTRIDAGRDRPTTTPPTTSTTSPAVAFRRFQSRIIVVFMGLFFLVLAAMLAAVDRVNTQHARAQISESLNIGGRAFVRLFDARSERLMEGVRILAGDFALRGAVATRDRDTILSALANHGARIGANVGMLVSLDNLLLVNTLQPQAAPAPFPFTRLTEIAQLNGQAGSIVFLGDRMFQLVVVPVYAPDPIAWVAMGFRVDEKLVQELRTITSAHVSFLRADPDTGEWSVVATTLPPELRDGLQQQLPSNVIGRNEPFALALADGEYETRVLPLAAEDDAPVVAVLQQSLDEALAPFYYLRLLLIALTGVGLAGVARRQRGARPARDQAGGGAGRKRARDRPGQVRPPRRAAPAGRARRTGGHDQPHGAGHRRARGPHPLPRLPRRTHRSAQPRLTRGAFAATRRTRGHRGQRQGRAAGHGARPLQ